MKNKLMEFYLDYVNNFITVERMAEYYEIEVDHCNSLISIGKYYHEQRVTRIKENEDYKNAKKRCDQCNPLVVNGVFCHETGCPTQHKKWVEDRQEWVRFVKCHECGFEVEEGETCSCNDPVEGE
jgi:hypothetical protein